MVHGEDTTVLYVYKIATVVNCVKVVWKTQHLDQWNWQL